MAKAATIDDVLAFWFDEFSESWFRTDPTFDTLVDARFGQAVEGIGRQAGSLGE